MSLECTISVVLEVRLEPAPPPSAAPLGNRRSREAIRPRRSECMAYHHHLDTHTTDLASLILEEDLHDVLLVGWSYGGMVIANVLAQTPQRIASMVRTNQLHAREQGDARTDEARNGRRQGAGAPARRHQPARGSTSTRTGNPGGGYGATAAWT